MWTFSDAEAYLADTAPPGKSIYGLGRINHLLDLLDHPERGFPCVTVVGTNGKGSTLAFLDSIIREHGPRVACHIKPHLQSVTERIRLNGSDSTESEFAESLWMVKKSVDGGWNRDDRPTYFELIFAAFMVAAADHDSDIALLETGLGGRLDAVNSVDAPLVIMTSIGLDHTELLGNSLEEITTEKLAVVRPGSTLVLQQNPIPVLNLALAFSQDNNVTLVESTTGPGDRKLGIGGPFQCMNAALAVTAFNTLASDICPSLFPGGVIDRMVNDGLCNARLPGRWETFHSTNKNQICILDGAHNPHALIPVLSEFRQRSGGKGTIVMGLKKGKDFSAIVPGLIAAAGTVIFTPLPYFESWEPDDLISIVLNTLDNSPDFSQIHFDKADSIVEGFNKAFALAPDDGVILVTGSLYLVGAARSFLISSGLIPDA